MTGLTYGEVKLWRAELLGTAADRIKENADALEKIRDKVESQTVPSSWRGLRAILAVVGRQRLVERMNAHLRDKRIVRDALYDAEILVSELELLVKDVEAEAKNHGFRIGKDGSIRNESTPPPSDSEYEDWGHESWIRERRSKAIVIYEAIWEIVWKASEVAATITASMPPGHVDHVDDYRDNPDRFPDFPIVPLPHDVVDGLGDGLGGRVRRFEMLS